MASQEHTLSAPEARAFYDRLGARQDWQRFFEDPATDVMIAAADLPEARAVVEFGCGTGRLAEHLLNDLLPRDCRYLALDQSTTMTRLARARLERFGGRSEVRQTDGSMTIGESNASFDRFVSAYVLDLLSSDQIEALTGEACRILRPEGRLCLVSLTHGLTFGARLFSRTWSRVHTFRPTLVGGCRPLELLDFLPEVRWRIDHREVVSRFGFSSEVVIASPR